MSSSLAKKTNITTCMIWYLRVEIFLVQYKMEDVEEALSTGNTRDLIILLRDIEEPDDFRILINQALDLQDFTSLWYIMEIGSRYDEDLDSYLLEQCGLNGQTLPCVFLQNRDNAISVLQDAVRDGDEDALLFALDLLYSPLDPTAFVGYSSQDYERTLAQSRLLDRQVENILQQASPTFFNRIFPLLPERLRVNLIMSS